MAFPFWENFQYNFGKPASRSSLRIVDLFGALSCVPVLNWIWNNRAYTISGGINWPPIKHTIIYWKWDSCMIARSIKLHTDPIIKCNDITIGEELLLTITADSAASKYGHNDETHVHHYFKMDASMTITMLIIMIAMMMKPKIHHYFKMEATKQWSGSQDYLRCRQCSVINNTAQMRCVDM